MNVQISRKELKVGKVLAVGLIVGGLLLNPYTQSSASANPGASSSQLEKEADKQYDKVLKDLKKMLRDGKVTLSEYYKFYYKTIKEKMDFVNQVFDDIIENK